MGLNPLKAYSCADEACDQPPHSHKVFSSSSKYENLCDPFFFFNGTDCEAFNPCVVDNGGCDFQSTRCIVTGFQSRRCICRVGYEQDPESSTSCLAVDCGPVNATQSYSNGILSTDATGYNTVVLLICNKHFLIPGSGESAIRCLADGTWSSFPLLCRHELDILRDALDPEGHTLTSWVGAEVDYNACSNDYYREITCVGGDKRLIIEKSELTGTIPPEIVSIEFAWITFSQVPGLHGPLPQFHPSLTRLMISNTSLSGPLKPMHYPHLTYMYVSNCLMNGSLPSFENCTSLEEMYVVAKKKKS
eukprot:GCRY01001391.1.p1 GENE.GCRY01001391.1~~GCRY01001391.1.p1  ORF type:complete len:304 (+),score=14.97 GCRY01001391.1:217-1128(+)